MSKFYSVGRSSGQKSILVLVLIIISSSVVTNITAILNEKFHYSEKVTSEKSPCDMLEMILTSSDFLNEVQSRGKEYVEEKFHDEDFYRYIDTYKLMPSSWKVLKNIPKTRNEPTAAKVLNQMDVPNTLGKIVVDLHHLVFRVEAIKYHFAQPGNPWNTEKSNLTNQILNFLDTETKQFVKRIEFLLPAFNAKLPSIVYERYEHHSHLRDEYSAMRALLYEYILLLEFINDVAKHISKKYCDDSNRNGTIVPHKTN